MESIALRPRSATEIVDAAIEVYRRNPVHFMLLAAIVQTPWLILQLVLLGNTSAVSIGTGEIATSLLISFGAIVSRLLLSAVVVQLASDLYLGWETDAFVAFQRVGWWKLLTAFAGAFLQGAIVLFGAMLFLLPAVYWTALYFAVIPVIVLERSGLFPAFERSARLSKDLKMHILSAIGLVFIIRFAIGIGMLFLVLIIPNAMAQRVISTLVSIIIDPIAGIAVTLIYYDARIRREGFDIEIMAAGSAPANAAAAVV